MVEENVFRFIFRPTTQQITRFNKLMSTGRFKHMSELLRRIMEIGMDDLEKD